MKRNGVEIKVQSYKGKNYTNVKGIRTYARAIIECKMCRLAEKTKWKHTPLHNSYYQRQRTSVSAKGADKSCSR